MTDLLSVLVTADLSSACQSAELAGATLADRVRTRAFDSTYGVVHPLDGASARSDCQESVMTDLALSRAVQFGPGTLSLIAHGI